MDIQKEIQKDNILVGAIRTPTVNKAIIRLTMNVQNEGKIKDICLLISRHINA